MRQPSFQASSRTAALIRYFLNLKMSDKVAYETISKSVGFKVDPAIMATARKRVERDHGVYIEIIRGYGVFRGTGADMKNSGPRFMSRARRQAKRCAYRMELALRNNLTVEEAQQASEMLSRSRIIFDTSTKPTVITNRMQRETSPDISNSVDNISRMKNLR